MEERGRKKAPNIGGGGGRDGDEYRRKKKMTWSLREGRKGEGSEKKTHGFFSEIMVNELTDKLIN